jgi:hypothetical protein
LPAALHHPLFESVALPLLVSLAGVAVLRLTSAPARAGAAVGLSVMAATIWLMGWPTRPHGVMQKLPWIFAVAWLLGVALDARQSRRFLQWLVLAAGWGVASWWLGGSALAVTAFVLAGAAVIGCLLWSPPERADGVSGAVVASLGLAAVCFAAGSLALFQLATLLAAALAGAALWLWPKARMRFGAAAVAVAAITWLALAQAALLLIAVQPPALVVLGLAFLAAPLVSLLWRRGSRLAAPIAVAAVSALLAAGALALQAGAGVGTAADDLGGADDAYYEK